MREYGYTAPAQPPRLMPGSVSGLVSFFLSLLLFFFLFLFLSDEMGSKTTVTGVLETRPDTLPGISRGDWAGAV